MISKRSAPCRVEDFIMRFKNLFRRFGGENPLFQTIFTFRETFCADTDGLAGCRRNLLGGNCFSGMVSSLTAGIYFTGLMLAMGASDVYIGYVASIISFCGFFQILSPMILERIPKRKKLVMSVYVTYHFLNIGLVGVLPLLPVANPIKLILFMVTLLILNVSNNLVSPGMLTWHLQCIQNNKKRIGFFAISSMISTVLNNATVLLAGLFLDKFEADEIMLGNISPTLSAILILRGVALVLAVFEVICYGRVKEAPYVTDASQAQKPGLRLLLRPLKNKQFLSAISVTLIWTFSTAIVGSYFSIYLLEDVNMSYSLISLVGMLAVPLNLLVSPMWTKVLQRKPWYKAILFSQLISIAAYALNPVVTADRTWFYMVCIGLGTIAGPGTSLAHSHLTYAYMPEENRTAYVSFNAVLGQIFSFLGTNVGVLFIQFSGNMSVNVLGLQMGNKQMINWISAALMLGLCAYTQIVVRKKLPE